MSTRDITAGQVIFTQTYMSYPPRMLDIATVGGVGGAFFMIFVAILAGSSLRAFLDIPSAMIVFGGTSAAVLASFSLSDLVEAIKPISGLIYRRDWNENSIGNYMLYLSDMVRKKGTLSMEMHLKDIADHPFLYKSMMMVIDQGSPEDIESVMEPEIATATYKTQVATKIFRKAAEVAPAMGLIGTLIGLVQMLGHLDDPKSIGPDMALALLTTLYGAILANVVFSPMASKLERGAAKEKVLNQIYLVSMMSIARREHPRRLEMLLNAILPPDKKLTNFHG